MLSRRQLADRVAVLAERHEGREFADAVARFADTLSDDERAVLGEILLERANEQGAFDAAFVTRTEARGWFRRQWDKTDPRRPPRL